MKALSCAKLFVCLLKLNRCLCAVKKVLIVMLCATVAGAALCCLLDSKGAKKAFKRLREMM